MVEYGTIKKRVEEQAGKVWDTDSIAAWLKRMTTDGIPRKVVDPKDVAGRKRQILDGVQSRAEACTFLGRV